MKNIIVSGILILISISGYAQQPSKRNYEMMTINGVEYPIWDYSKDKDLYLLNHIWQDNAGGGKMELFLYNGKTKEMTKLYRNDNRGNANIHRAKFTVNSDSVSFFIDVKNEVTKDNPLGVGHDSKFKSIPIKQ